MKQMGGTATVMVVLAVLGLMAFFFLAMTPVDKPIASLEETSQIMDQLGLKWQWPGVPVIVFMTHT